MADAWQVVQIESDTLTGLATAGQTILRTTYVPNIASPHIQIDDHRGLSKNYSMFLLFWGDLAAQ